MAKEALLVLEDGTIYHGYSFGTEVCAAGEVVFNTSMTGYQEMLTDPSYGGQLLVLTYPLIGNYGVNSQDNESRRIQVSGLIVREDCPLPSHWQSQGTVGEYLLSEGVPGICGVDTRALTRRLRNAGVMMGMVAVGLTAEEALAQLRSQPRYGETDLVRRTSTDAAYQWQQSRQEKQHSIVVVDYGVKYNILRILTGLGCKVTVLPCTASADEILAQKPDGVLLSPGPGDPAMLDYAVESVKRLVEKVPIMGICLGHQVIGRAFGADTFKLKFGHRGANHPVQDLTTGRVYITAQNHGYAVDGDGLRDGLEVSHINLNDGTVEGLRHRELPILTIQYHSEASPGPQDNVYLFERWLEIVERESVPR